MTQTGGMSDWEFVKPDGKPMPSLAQAAPMEPDEDAVEPYWPSGEVGTYVYRREFTEGMTLALRDGDKPPTLLRLTKVVDNDDGSVSLTTEPLEGVPTIETEWEPWCE